MKNHPPLLAFNLKYFALAVFLFLVEYVIARFVHDRIIRPYIGDLLVVILLYSLLKSFLNVSVNTALVSVLLFSFFIESTQYFNLIGRLGLSESRAAQLILGNSFSWIDMIAYSIGIALTWKIEDSLRKRKDRNTSKNQGISKEVSHR